MKFFAGFMTGVVVTLLGVLFWLRTDATTPVADPTETATNLPSGFAEFYDQFHQDSLYQVEHIMFPLAGFPADADSVDLSNNQFRWQKEGWVLHRPFDDMDGQFERELLVLNDDMIVEEIKGVQADYGMQRRFSRLSDGWFLIYYAGMNKFAAPAESAAPVEE